MRIRSAFISGLGALAATVAFACVCAGEARAASVSATVSLGYDSFIDRFTILDVDTLEMIEELYAGLGGALSFGGSRARAGLTNRLRLGTQTIDETFDVETAYRASSRTRVDLRGSFHGKHFQESSDYTFGNDYAQADALLRVRTDLGREITLGLRSRYETIRYRERSQFDYDYSYGDAGLEAEHGKGINRSIRLAAVLGFREAPDTTALSFRRTLIEAEGLVGKEPGFLGRFEVAADRRGYRETVRSSYWTVLSSFEISRTAGTEQGYALRVESELYSFDRPDTIIYFDTHFLRAGFRVRIPIRTATMLTVEPRVARMFCPASEEERYGEISGAVGIDYIGSNGLWISASYEPGYRNYLLEDNEIYSDFTLHRISLMGTAPLPRGMSLSIFLNHEPERHSRRDDDFSITLASVEISKRF